MSNLVVYPTRQFATAFRNLLAEGPSSITIVSPFLTPVKPWASVLAFTKFVLSRGTGSLEIITCPPCKNDFQGMPNIISHAEAELIEAEGVVLKIRNNNLHAKLFYMEFKDPDRYAAFIGSSNFTAGGFERNDETMVKIAHPADLVNVRREVTRLSGHGSFPYYAWKAYNLHNMKGV
jgi:phosphatidylserine/phosphatidylglycerophosphate/cardiolipin synthase-like enzyme